MTSPATLLTPIRMGAFHAVNRVAMAPMTNKQSAEDGTLSGAEIDWIAQRAEGGFGVVITGAWAVAARGACTRLSTSSPSASSAGGSRPPQLSGSCS